MSDMKTVPTKASVQEFINSVEHKGRKEDALQLLELYAQITPAKPTLWGPSIIGFGAYKYQRADGSKHAFALAGFSPRKANMAVYLMSGCNNHSEKLARLGPHKHTSSCLYFGRLAKVDLMILGELITSDIAIMKDTHPSASL